MFGNKVSCNLMCMFDWSSCRIAAIAKRWWMGTVLRRNRIASHPGRPYMASLEDRDTCGCPSGFHVVLGATWLSRGPRNLWMPKRISCRSGNNMALLRAETLVDALADFMAFWERHGSLEDRDTCGCLGGLHDVLGATWLS